NIASSGGNPTAMAAPLSSRRLEIGYPAGIGAIGMISPFASNFQGPRAYSRQRLLLSYPHRNPAVFGASFFRRVVRHRVLFALTLIFTVVSRNAQAHQLLRYAASARLGQSEVGPRVTHIIGISANLDVDVWIGLQDFGYRPELLLRFGLEAGRSGVELQSIE